MKFRKFHQSKLVGFSGSFTCQRIRFWMKSVQSRLQNYKNVFVICVACSRHSSAKKKFYGRCVGFIRFSITIDCNLVTNFTLPRSVHGRSPCVCRICLVSYTKLRTIYVTKSWLASMINTPNIINVRLLAWYLIWTISIFGWVGCRCVVRSFFIIIIVGHFIPAEQNRAKKRRSIAIRNQYDNTVTNR